MVNLTVKLHAPLDLPLNNQQVFAVAFVDIKIMIFFYSEHPVFSVCVCARVNYYFIC